MNKYIFYHIYAVNNWQEIVQEQVNLILESGILDEIQKVYYTVLCEAYSIDHPKFEQFHQDGLQYEFPTLVELQERCLKEDCWALYIHTKGVSRRDQAENVDCWRRYMGYFTVKRYKDCFKYLEQGYDGVGVDLGTGPFLHFSGNFFWTTSNYVRKLLLLREHPWLTNDRLYAEKWLGSENGNMKGLMHSVRLLYCEPIREDEYIGKEV